MTLIMEKWEDRFLTKPLIGPLGNYEEHFVTLFKTNLSQENNRLKYFHCSSFIIYWTQIQWQFSAHQTFMSMCPSQSQLEKETNDYKRMWLCKASQALHQPIREHWWCSNQCCHEQRYFDHASINLSVKSSFDQAWGLVFALHGYSAKAARGNVDNLSSRDFIRFEIEFPWALLYIWINEEDKLSAWTSAGKSSAVKKCFF